MHVQAKGVYMHTDPRCHPNADGFPIESGFSRVSSSSLGKFFIATVATGLLVRDSSVYEFQMTGNFYTNAKLLCEFTANT